MGGVDVLVSMSVGRGVGKGCGRGNRVLLEAICGFLRPVPCVKPLSSAGSPIKNGQGHCSRVEVRGCC